MTDSAQGNELAIMRTCLTSKDNEIIKASSQARHPVSLFTIKGLSSSDSFYISTAGWGTFSVWRLWSNCDWQRAIGGGESEITNLCISTPLFIELTEVLEKKKNLIRETEGTQKTSLSGLRQEALFQFCMAGRRQCDGARKDRHRHC